MKKQIILFLFGLTIGSVSLFAQQIPKGYNFLKDTDYLGDEIGCKHLYDLDGDNIKDKVEGYIKGEDESTIIAIQLSSSNSLKWFPFSTLEAYDIEYENNVLKIVTRNSIYQEVIKFKYYSTINSLRLIGYDFVNTSNYGQSDSNDFSINFLTNSKVEKVKNIIIKLKNYYTLIRL